MNLLEVLLNHGFNHGARTARVLHRSVGVGLGKACIGLDLGKAGLGEVFLEPFADVVRGGRGFACSGCCSLSGFGLHFLSPCFGGGSLRFNLVQHFGLDGFPGFGGSRRFSSGRIRHHLHAFGGLGGTAATAGTTAAAVAFDHLLTVAFRRIRGGRLTVFGVSGFETHFRVKRIHDVSGEHGRRTVTVSVTRLGEGGIDVVNIGHGLCGRRFRKRFRCLNRRVFGSCLHLAALAARTRRTGRFFFRGGSFSRSSRCFGCNSCRCSLRSSSCGRHGRRLFCGIRRFLTARTARAAAAAFFRHGVTGGIVSGTLRGFRGLLRLTALQGLTGLIVTAAELLTDMLEEA